MSHESPKIITDEEEQEGYEKMLKSSEATLENFPEHVVVDLELLAESNEDLREPIEQMILWCKRYTLTVIEFEKLATDPDASDRFQELGESRGKTHDATMDAINLVVREMNKSFEDTEWATENNLHNVEHNRVHYAKFAIMFTLKKLLLDTEEEEREQV